MKILKNHYQHHKLSKNIKQDMKTRTCQMSSMKNIARQTHFLRKYKFVAQKLGF